MVSIARHPGRVVAIGIAVLIAILALLPGTWSTAQAQTAGTPTPTATATETATVVAPGASATVTVGSDQTIRIPAGTFGEQVTVTSQQILDNASGTSVAVAEVFASLSVPTPDEVAEGDAVVLSIFSIEAVDAGGQEPEFDGSVVMEIELTPAVLAAAGGDASNVVLQFFDEATSTWTPVSCTASGAVLSCTLPHFSVWALVLQTDPTAQATPTTTATSTGTGTATPSTTGTVTAPSPADTGMGSGGDGGSGSTLLMMVAGALSLAAGVGILSRRALRGSRTTER